MNAAAQRRPRLGCVIPNGSLLMLRHDLTELARTVEAAGADSIWFADHLVMPERPATVHPYSSSRLTQPSRVQDASTPWFEALACCAHVAAVTERVAIGVGVLVLPQRNPIEVAKIAATIDVLAAGRLVLGVGAGWLREEFAAVGADFDTRGPRLDEGIELLRSCWTGSPEPYDGRFHSLPAGIQVVPRPRHGTVPLLVGGNTTPALRRAAATGDGWIGIAADHSDYVGEAVERLRWLELERRRRNRTNPFRTVLRIVQSDPTDTDQLRMMVHQLAALAPDELVVEPDWTDPPTTIATVARLAQEIDAGVADARC